MLEIDTRKFKKAIDKIEKQINPKLFKKATIAGLNRAMTKTRTVSDREVTNIYALKKKDVRAATKISKATTRQIIPFARISYKSGSFSLMKFGARQTKKGVTYKVLKKGGRTTLQSGFIQTMPNTGKDGMAEGVFTRKSIDSLPIFKHNVITIQSMFRANPDIVKKIEIAARDLTFQEIRQALKAAKLGIRF